MREKLIDNKIFIYSILVVAISFFTYFKGYETPNKVFWDENYHIASAQKHIEGVMYMEPHPPLGKMLIALGEVIVGVNSDIDRSVFAKTDYIKGGDFPSEYSFAGVRLFPTLFATLSGVLIFYILYLLTSRAEISLAFSSLYLFENAIIIHSRAAMLDSTQIFFILCAILYLTYIVKKDDIRLSSYAILGVFSGLAIAVKLNSMIVLLLFVFLWFFENRAKVLEPFENLFSLLRSLFASATISVVSIAAIFFVVMYIHVGMGERIETKSYKASQEYKEILQNSKNRWNPANAYIMIRDNLSYMSTYHEGVPKLDICKPGENGSYAIGWPLMTKSINYRWDKNVEDGISYVKYHQLQGNPIIWYSVFLGVILSFVLIISSAVFKTPIKDKRLFSWIVLFSSLYFCYFLAILQIDRVMYLYHYFLAFIFGMINLALIFSYIFKEEIESKSKFLYLNLSIFVALVLFCFWHFAPFAYNIALTPEEFELRNWFDYWGMRVVR